MISVPVLYDTLKRYGSRGWFACLCGLLLAFSMPPFNHESHWLLAPLPLLSCIALLPLLSFAIHPSFGAALRLCWLYGIFAAGGQYYWIVFNTAEGVWHLIIMGVIGLTLLFGAYYLAMGMLFRLCHRCLPRAEAPVFAAVWVLSEYLRTLGEMSFPWTLIGYAFTPLSLPAQMASLGGVYLLSLLIVLGNVTIWQWLRFTAGVSPIRPARALLLWLCVMACGTGYGALRLLARDNSGPVVRVANLQINLDPLRRGKGSIDTAFAAAESLVFVAAREQPDLMVLPESALLCYLAREAERTLQVLRWVDATATPLILGSLHWNRGEKGSIYRYLVYNAAFYVDPRARVLHPYLKMKLVPFSEALPFEGLFPILSRVNLGEADFKRGIERTVFMINDSLGAVPLICYEVIYPAFVRMRLDTTAHILVNITNDGWFGRSPGPYHHAAMARLRCIENGISMARCANTGISMVIDQYGRVLTRSALFERSYHIAALPLKRIRTLYTRCGDWVVWLSLCACCLMCIPAIRRHMQ